MKKVSKIKHKKKAKPAVKKVKKVAKSPKAVKKGGVSPLRILSDTKMEQLKKLHKGGTLTAKQLATKFGVSISTLYNYLNR